MLLPSGLNFFLFNFTAVFHENNNQFSDVYRLFRAPLLLMQFMFLIGVNVYGWRSSGVNHVLIFELDPRNHLSEQHLMELSAILGVSWALSVLSFLYSSYISIPPYVSPLVLLILILAFVLNPVKAFHYDARFWLVKLIVSVFYYLIEIREINSPNC